MASRYPTTPVIDYCLHPVRVVVDNIVNYVPCGKCDGCLLHKSNEWSMRLGVDIESCPFPIFVTYTYSNKYLPTFRLIDVVTDSYDLPYQHFCNYHLRNIRFNGVEDDLRREDFINYYTYDLSFRGVPATNYVSDVPYFPYTSKRDFQLYLKLLRKDIYEKFRFSKTDKERKIRYFAISEYGETLLRPHIHAVFLVYEKEVAEYLLYEGLFKSWQMCDRNYFQQFCRFCDSGCRGYVTQYLTCNSKLPQVYKEDNLKPWRLSSKNPAIGYYSFDKEEILEAVSRGTIQFNKNISRLDEQYVLRYPSSYCSRVFPKCFEYRKYDFRGLLSIYGLLFFLIRYGQEDFEDVAGRLRHDEHSQDWQAMLACFKACESYGLNPESYVFFLDKYYYLSDMYTLRFWYTWQENETDVTKIISSYSNFNEYLRIYRNQLYFKDDYIDDYKIRVFGSFCEGFRLSPDDVDGMYDVDFSLPVNEEYALEVSDILSDMVKMPKFNEKYGLSPNSVIY